ncbi:MAG TPA: carbohydrate-binding family 9-like protein, partial [Caldilineaceae bacterium]|nr:carbohydrate-binding family 9-like protein [Caldilineaceae bacterium]
RVGEEWNRGRALADWGWEAAATLPPFTLAAGSGPAQQQTVTRICYNDQALFVRFDCADRDIWGTLRQRDDPIYDEEVVEVFIGPGEETPIDYYEFEVSPHGVMLDLTVHSPNGNRNGMVADFAWDCPGLEWAAGYDEAAQHWWAVMVLPWASIGAPGQLPKLWRANFYRIERPHDSAAEFSCWSPTLTDPADYHRPARFGLLELG